MGNAVIFLIVYLGLCLVILGLAWKAGRTRAVVRGIGGWVAGAVVLLAGAALLERGVPWPMPAGLLLIGALVIGYAHRRDGRERASSASEAS